jgi:hypothetical protein
MSNYQPQPQRGLVVHPLGSTKFGEVDFSCPNCSHKQKLYYHVRNFLQIRQLVSGDGTPTCHIMMCNCEGKTTEMTPKQVSMLESLIAADNPEDYFGKDATPCLCRKCASIYRRWTPTRPTRRETNFHNIFPNSHAYV